MIIQATPLRSWRSRSDAPPSPSGRRRARIFTSSGLDHAPPTEAPHHESRWCRANVGSTFYSVDSPAAGRRSVRVISCWCAGSQRCSSSLRSAARPWVRKSTSWSRLVLQHALRRLTLRLEPVAELNHRRVAVVERREVSHRRPPPAGDGRRSARRSYVCVLVRRVAAAAQAPSAAPHRPCRLTSSRACPWRARRPTPARAAPPYAAPGAQSRSCLPPSVAVARANRDLLRCASLMNR